MPGGGLQTQFDGRYPQHGRAFLTADFVAAAFEGGRRGLLCSRAFLYSLCFILLYRRFTCFGSILRNLSFWFPPEFFGAWLPRFLFVCCSVAGGIKINSRNLYQRLSANALCSNALVFPHIAGRGGGKLEPEAMRREIPIYRLLGAWLRKSKQNRPRSQNRSAACWEAGLLRDVKQVPQSTDAV